MESDTITRQNQANETKTKISDFTTRQVQVPESSIMQVQHQEPNTPFTIQKEVSATSNSELVPLTKIEILEDVHPIIRKLFTEKHSKCTITLFHNSLRKNCSASRYFIYYKRSQKLICKSFVSLRKYQPWQKCQNNSFHYWSTKFWKCWRKELSRKRMERTAEW